MTTTTETPRRSREDLLAHTRSTYEGRDLPSRTKLAAELGTHYNTAKTIHETLTTERDRAAAERRQERRRTVVSMGRRKGSGRASRLFRSPLQGPSVSPISAIPAPLAELPDADVTEVVVQPADEPAEVPSVAARPMPIGAVVTLAVSTALIIGGAVAISHQGLPGSPSVLAAGAVAALLAAVAAVWSAALLGRALVAGRTGRDVALDLASWTVAGVAGYLAAYGQVKFAEWAEVTSATKYLVPGILEPSVVVLLLLANRRVRRRRAGLPAKPVGKLLALAGVLGGFAVYTNVVHAGGRTGLVFGAATVVGLILWWVKLQDDAAPDDWDDAPQSERLSRRTSRYRLLRWVILPGQTRRAWLISLDHSVANAEQGLELARRWRRAYDEARDLKQSRRKAKRAAARVIDQYLEQVSS